jgi:hypothetical protein
MKQVIDLRAVKIGTGWPSKDDGLDVVAAA